MIPLLLQLPLLPLRSSMPSSLCTNSSEVPCIFELGYFNFERKELHGAGKQLRCWTNLVCVRGQMLKVTVINDALPADTNALEDVSPSRAQRLRITVPNDDDHMEDVKRCIVAILDKQEGGRMPLKEFSIALYKPYGGKQGFLDYTVRVYTPRLF